ncbi:MAG: hypothetical protein V1809_01390 [Planctomycetota bacterium]
MTTPPPASGDCDSLPLYTAGQVALANIPYALMLVLGAGVFVAAWGPDGRVPAALYAAYGLLGSLWIILFVCPYCHFHGTRSCPCGYGIIAAKLRRAQDGGRFAEKFRAHIPVIVPLWFIPPVVGGWGLVKQFTPALLVFVVLFALDAFLILPLLSRRRCCARCPQKTTCPWMGK